MLLEPSAETTGKPPVVEAKTAAPLLGRQSRGGEGDGGHFGVEPCTIGRCVVDERRETQANETNAGVTTQVPCRCANAYGDERG